MSTRNELIVGLCFMSGVGLLGAYTIMISGITLFGTKTYVVDFDQVYGLKEGDGVRVEGHELGEVKSLRLLPTGRVRAAIEVASNVDIFRDGGQVRVTPFSPLGGRVVEITRGRPGPAGIYRPWEKGMSDEETEQVAIHGQAEGELLQTLNSLVEENRKSVGRIVANLDHVSQQLTLPDSGVLGYLINDGEGAAQLEGLVNHLSSASDHLDRILTRVDEGQGVVGALVVPDSALGRDLEEAARAGRGALGSADEILARANRGDSALGVLVGDAQPARDQVAGIVADVKEISGNLADPEGQGTISRLLHDGRLYDGAADTFEHLASITGKVDDGHGLLGVLTEEQAGDDVRETLRHVASISRAVDDPEGGALGLLVHDDVLRGRVARIATEVERLVVEFRDSLEDVREQAPINAFIGAVFAAF